MTTSAPRNQWLDLFRGLAFVAIVVDHIPGSPLAQLTPRNVALADASEIFVFVSGIAATLAFEKTALRRGVAEARDRMLRRSVKIYLAYLGMAVGLLACGVLLNAGALDYQALWSGYVAQFVADPVGYLARVALLMAQPTMTDVLPLYVVLVLASPWIVRGMAAAPSIMLAGSLALWTVAPELNALLPHERPAGLFFNPFAWQFLFVLGSFMGLHGGPLLARLDRHAGKVTWLAGIVAAAAAALALSWRMPELQGVFPPPAINALIEPISKSDLDALRLASFFALAWLVRLTVLRLAVDWSAPLPAGLALIGRNGLPAFCFGAVLSLAADVVARNLPFPGIDYVVAMLAIGGLWAIARVAERGLLPPRPAAQAL